MARILVAASPEPRNILERVLEGHEVSCAQDLASAEHLLRRQSFDQIVCTVLFDDSRMFDLLRLAKSARQWRLIPFVCARIRSSTLDSRIALEAVAFTCHSLGAAAFLDMTLYEIEPERKMREALDRLLAAPPPGP